MEGDGANVPERREISRDEYGFLKFIGFTRYDYSKEALLSEVSGTLGEVPFEWEKKLFSLSPEKRKLVIEKLIEIKSLEDLDAYL